MKKIILVIGILWSVGTATPLSAQFHSVKSNLLEWAALGTLNAEWGKVLHRNYSLHLPVSYNPWVFSNNSRMQHITITPGVRYWTLEANLKHFVGVNLIGTRYHAGGFSLIDKDYRYDGWGGGLGISYGYALPLNKRWNMEFELGVGAIYGSMDVYRCPTCSPKVDEKKGVYFLPNKVGVSFIYLY